VKPRTGPQVQSERGSEMRVTSPAAKALPDLSAGELEVLALLRRAGTGLTVGQLGARLPSSAPILDTLLGALMERGLVARLNTIVPSYTCRRADAGVHAE
jgi:hypothetical protein